MSKNLDDLVSALADSAYRNRLVLFLGAGFSKAVMGYDPTDLDDHYSNEKAEGVLSWLELLEKCRAKLSLPPKKYVEKQEVVIDCPLEASSIVAEVLSNDSSLNYKGALLKLKDAVCQLVDWYPEPDQACDYQEIFQKIRPVAIITTNYDEVVETILHSGYFSYGPSNTFGGLPNDFTPIYHIHGIRGQADSILITREDYVQALRFSSYRQTRLACLLRENAVLYVGYGKNDINILSALDVARNSFSDLSEGVVNIHVQLLHSPKDGYKIVETELGQYSIEIKDTYNFFKQIAKKCENLQKEFGDSFNKFNESANLILALSSDMSTKVVKRKRKEFSRLIKWLARKVSENTITSVQAKSLLIKVIQKFFSDVHGKTSTYGNFSAYDDSLFVLIELIENMETLGVRSFFFDFVAKHLEAIARYIGDERGQSWEAYETIKKRWHTMPEKVIGELEESARIHSRSDTLRLLERVRRDVGDCV